MQDKESGQSNTVDVPEHSHAQPSPAPDGGVQAWLQVLGAHFLFFNSWGIINVFGAYQQYYETDLLKGRSSSEVSWIGTFQGFLVIFLGIIGGPIYDRGYFHALIAVGTFLTVFGLMMASLASEYWQIFLSHGLCVGIGTGLLFLPSVALVATYFTTKRSLALGITASGGSIGSTIYTIVFRNLQPKLGAPWATRVIGFLALATLMISLAIMKPRLPPLKKSRNLVDPSVFRSPSFILLCCGMFLAFAGLYIPFFYIVLFAQRKAGITGDLSFYLLSILNAASVFGRVLPGTLADKFGALEVLTICTLASTVLSYAWIATHDLGGLIAFCILYGFASGAVLTLPASVVTHLAPNLQLVGTWMGMSFVFCAIGILIGNPIAGALINVEEGKFTGGLMLAASATLVASVTFAGIGFIRFRAARKSKK